MISSFLTTSWTWTANSNWVNDLRFGWNLFDRIDNVADYQTPVTAYGINTGITAANLQGFPTISVSGFTDLGGDSRAPKLSGPGNDYDIVDHVSFLHGNHDFQFGGEILTFRAFFNEVSIGRGQFKFNGGQTVTGTRGTLKLTPLEDYLAGIPTQGVILEGVSARNLSQSSYSGFFEDTWRVKPRVTVDLGLRYEYYTPLADRNNLIGSWDPSVGFEQVGVNIKSPYNPDSKDFSPRVGVAWDVTGKGTTVLRAGGGIYYTNVIVDQLINSKGGIGRAPGITAIPTSYTLYAANGSSTPADKHNSERHRLGQRNHIQQPTQLDDGRTGISVNRVQQLRLRRWHRSHQSPCGGCAEQKSLAVQHCIHPPQYAVSSRLRLEFRH